MISGLGPALIVKSAEGADVGCGERSEPHQTRRAEAMRFVPHRILRRCSVAHGRRYDQGPSDQTYLRRSEPTGGDPARRIHARVALPLQYPTTQCER